MEYAEDSSMSENGKGQFVKCLTESG